MKPTAILFAAIAAGCSSNPTSPPDASTATPQLILAREGLGPEDVAVLVNSDDPQSVAVGAHYMQARHIPAANLVSLPLGGDFSTMQQHVITATNFATWK